jgi:type I restriction enzyme R subunit
MNSAFTESTVEQAALGWVESVGWVIRNGAEIAPGEPAAERDDYGQVLLARGLRDALLPKVISGELRVKDPERFVGRHV